MEPIAAAGPLAWIVIVAAGLTACGVIWRKAGRPAWRTWRKAKVFAITANEIVTRELTHNGGGSLKDVVQSIHQAVGALAFQMQSARGAVDDNHRAVEALARVMDELVERKQEEHDRLWQQIDLLWQQVIDLGGRRPPTTGQESP